MKRKRLKLAEARPGDILTGAVQECPECKTLFVGSSDSLYCCRACNEKAQMRRRKEERRQAKQVNG